MTARIEVKPYSVTVSESFIDYQCCENPNAGDSSRRCYNCGLYLEFDDEGTPRFYKEIS